MTKILIVGGAGYIGSHTVKELQAKGYECVVIDNLTYGHADAVHDVPLIEADLMDKEQLRAIFSQYNFSCVIHFAAFTYVEESVQNPSKYYYNNVVGTLNLLDAMREFQVMKIVFSSSCATYGNPTYSPIDEEHPQNPISPYGKSKLMVEQILKDYERAYGIKYVGLRYFNAAGCDKDGLLGERHDPETHLIPIVLEVAMHKRKEVLIYGNDYPTADGTCIRDYIHVDDLARAHYLSMELLLQEHSESHFFNLGAGIGVSVMEIVATVEHITGEDIPWTLAGRREGDPDTLLASNSKAKEILNWQPKYLKIDDIISTAWEWLKKQN